MMIPFGYERVPKYEPYKKQKFEKYKQKARMLCQGIGDSSLKKGDKLQLLKELKEIILNYNL